MQNLTLYLLLLLGMCIPFHGYAEVYKWVDEHGQTHYGEKPPEGEATEIKIQDTPGADASMHKQYEERDKLLKIYEEERNIKEEEKRKAEEQARKQAEKCREVENELKDIHQGHVVYYTTDDKGERRYLSDAELDQRARKFQEQYNQHCK